MRKVVLWCCLVGVAGFDYLKLEGYGCTDYGNWEPHGILSDADCQEKCDLDSSCYAWEQYSLSGCSPLKCATYEECTGVGKRSCGGHISFYQRSSSTSTTFKVACGTSSTCCGVSGDCATTPTRPNFCLISYTSGGYRVKGTTTYSDVLRQLSTGTTFSRTVDEFTSDTSSGFFTWKSTSYYQYRPLTVCAATQAPTASPSVWLGPWEYLDLLEGWRCNHGNAEYK
eukprot:Hpha_TRINITY_DN2322_c0_g1::TRINITY_DN2322_c0_g1_i1::g.367::m.367